MKNQLQLLGLALCFTAATQAQQNKQLFAITSSAPNTHNWTQLRSINLQDKTQGEVQYNGNDQSLTMLNAKTKKAVEFSTNTNDYITQYAKTPMSYGVAAAGLDARHNRLYFVPMRIDELRYIDLDNGQLYTYNDQKFTGEGNFPNQEGKVVTRMVIDDEGTGYALSNDGSQFIQFSTGRKQSINNLGAVKDAAANKVSIHVQCTSWGGDMVADDAGNLYVVSMQAQVFKLNIKTREALHIGKIEGLPLNFTVNGAAILADGKMIVSSASNNSDYYTVDVNTWQAQAFNMKNKLNNASDLASPYVIKTGNNPFAQTETRVAPVSDTKSAISVYPNPVVNKQFKLQMANLQKGNYNVTLTDALGRLVQTNQVIVGGSMQVENINLVKEAGKGVYIVKVVDQTNQTVSTNKITVQ
jgi:hypothetical protein